MKKLLTIFMLVSSLLLSEESFFKQDDKQTHMQVTAVIGFVASNIAYDVGYTEAEAFWIGVASALAIGLGKELLDSQSDGNKFDGEDMLANGIGGAIGSLPVFIIYRW